MGASLGSHVKDDPELAAHHGVVGLLRLGKGELDRLHLDAVRLGKGHAVLYFAIGQVDEGNSRQVTVRCSDSTYGSATKALGLRVSNGEATA